MSFRVHGGRMTNKEAALELIKEYENWGCFALFKGVAPFYFLKKLGVFHIIELVDGDPSSKVCLSSLRIFNYLKRAIDEVGYKITIDGMIVDRDGIVHDPKVLLSVKHAPSGWEIHSLLYNYGEIVRTWLAENYPDG